MLDFTSSLYLGFAHATEELEPWKQLTTGRPAAHEALPGIYEIECALASLIGTERALVAPSTLHFFWDLFGILARWPIVIYFDSRLYPVARWGVERAAAKGVRVNSFGHQDTGKLEELLCRDDSGGSVPVVVTDGLCTACGRAAPIASYIESLRLRRGLLVLDDTQALGILGLSPSANAPYGRGGGGSVRWCGIDGWHSNVAVISSMAKAFGAPLAVMASTKRLIDLFEGSSETRVHSSPPSMAALRAGAHALHLNRAVGDRMRARLTRNVARFRGVLESRELKAMGGLFPVQTLDAGVSVDASTLHARLGAAGVRVVLRDDSRISLLITARHSTSEIDKAAAVLANLTSEFSPTTWAARWISGGVPQCTSLKV